MMNKMPAALLTVTISRAHIISQHVKYTFTLPSMVLSDCDTSICMLVVFKYAGKSVKIIIEFTTTYQIDNLEI